MQNFIILFLCNGNPWTCPNSQQVAITLALFPLFLVLALFWWWTGRLKLIGWLVKIIWLPLRIILFILGKLCQLLASERIAGVLFLGSGIFAFITNNLSWTVFFALLLFFGGFGQLLAELIGKNLIKLARCQPKSRKNVQSKLIHAPTVKVAVSTLGYFEHEAQLIEQLPPHLQALLGMTSPITKPTSETSEEG